MDVEVKVLIAETDWSHIQNGIPDDVDEKKREIWFFDTPDLLLKQQEVVLRARVNRKKGKVDTTTKWRRWVSPYVSVLNAWQQLDGFKAEIDASVTESVPAWSITVDDLKEEKFRAVVAQDKTPLDFFSEQQQLLAKSAWPKLPWKKLQALGPIASSKWELDHEISIERWSINADSVIEISKRGDDQASTLRKIYDWLKTTGAEANNLAGGKTAWALERLRS